MVEALYAIEIILETGLQEHDSVCLALLMQSRTAIWLRLWNKGVSGALTRLHKSSLAPTQIHCSSFVYRVTYRDEAAEALLEENWLRVWADW